MQKLTKGEPVIFVLDAPDTWIDKHVAQFRNHCSVCCAHGIPMPPIFGACGLRQPNALASVCGMHQV
jgi:hypothetical protein